MSTRPPSVNEFLDTLDIVIRVTAMEEVPEHRKAKAKEVNAAAIALRDRFREFDALLDLEETAGTLQ